MQACRSGQYSNRLFRLSLMDFGLFEVEFPRVSVLVAVWEFSASFLSNTGLAIDILRRRPEGLWCDLIPDRSLQIHSCSIRSGQDFRLIPPHLASAETICFYGIHGRVNHDVIIVHAALDSGTSLFSLRTAVWLMDSNLEAT